MGSSLDKQSITLLRNVSRGGWSVPADLLAGTSPEETSARLHGLADSGIIERFHAVPIIPALVAGTWGRYAIRFHKKESASAQNVCQALTFLEESIHNAVFFTKRFPETTLFVFSKTQEELDLILREAGVETKPMLIRSYNFPFPINLSDEESLLMRTINQTGEILPSILADHMNKGKEWIKAKLERLVLHNNNPQGVVVLRASINWYKINNFMHAHILLPPGAKDHFVSLFKGFVWNQLGWPPETAESLAVEADFTGWGDFAAFKVRSEQAGFPVLGFALFVQERVWGRGYRF